MVKNFIKAQFDDVSMIRKLKKLSKSYGESQEQAVKRWGVQTCRDLAKYTLVVGSKPKFHKKAMMKDALNVIYSFDGSAKKAGKSTKINLKSGKSFYVSDSRLLTNEEEVLRWIEQHRTAKNKRTVKLSIDQRKVCSNRLLKRSINQKHKLLSGIAKDGWLDAGEDIAKGQKGPNPDRIGEKLMKFARKPKKTGKATERKRFFKSFAELDNFLSHSRNNYVLRNSLKREAIREGLRKCIKSYRKMIIHENKKKK